MGSFAGKNHQKIRDNLYQKQWKPWSLPLNMCFLQIFLKPIAKRWGCLKIWNRVGMPKATMVIIFLIPIVFTWCAHHVEMCQSCGDRPIQTLSTRSTQLKTSSMSSTFFQLKPDFDGCLMDIWKPNFSNFQNLRTVSEDNCGFPRCVPGIPLNLWRHGFGQGLRWTKRHCKSLG